MKIVPELPNIPVHRISGVWETVDATLTLLQKNSTKAIHILFFLVLCKFQKTRAAAAIASVPNNSENVSLFCIPFHIMLLIEMVDSNVAGDVPDLPTAENKRSPQTSTKE